MFTIFFLFVIAWMVYDMIMENVIEVTVYPHFFVFIVFVAILTVVVTKIMYKKGN